ncbi:MAG: DUF2130 domain-containing protein [Legionellales bacterium]|nr:DUF2130 domain-containing protein [Legionellales bacterium]
MALNEQKIQCPKCGTSISIDDVLTHQIGEKIKKDFEAAQHLKEEELAKQSEQLKKQAAELIENKKNLDTVIAEKLADQLKSERLKIFKDAKKEAEKEQSSLTSLLEEQLKNKDEKLQQATQNEIELRKEKIKLEESKQAFELEKIRQLEEAKNVITEEAGKKAAEEQQYIVVQLKKQLTDAIKAKDDLARKLEQGSQKAQGDVLEVELEELLKAEFPHDEIMPVPIGVTGADIIQKVIDRNGRVCGQIAWETKKTKSWNENWIQKLKDDQRAIKADLAVIVSAALPENVKGFIFRDGVWICDIKMTIALAIALRMNLEALTREKGMSVGKNEKMEVLYSYLTGVEFKQRVEAIVEAFTSMDTGLRKERLAYEKIWAEREKQLRKVISNTVGMYGDLSGLVALPQIKMLELGEDGE